jgi:hypothetical protein
MTEKNILVEFLFDDTKYNKRSYCFECFMSHIPRVGDSIELPSSDPKPVVLKYNGLSVFSAVVDKVHWNVIKHESDWPDVVISCSLVWV